MVEALLNLPMDWKVFFWLIIRAGIPGHFLHRFPLPGVREATLVESA
jgi:hypothetical protein